MALRVNVPDGVIELILPKRYTNLEAKIFLETHQDWVRKKAKTLPRSQPFHDAMILNIAGKNKILNIEFDPTLKTTHISYTSDTELRIRSPRLDPTSNIIRFLKRELENLIVPMVAQKCLLIGKEPPRITIRQAKTQWGSCSHDGRLSFSWRLIFAPLETIDYVVAHEVAHRVHFNHSRAFWALTKKLSLHYDIGRNWLTQQSHTIMRIGCSADNQPRLEE